MKYFAKYDKNGMLLAISTGAGETEISETQYNNALRVIREKAEMVERVIAETIDRKDIPEEWREEIEKRAADRMAQLQNEQISADEALEILMGGEADDA